MARPGRRFAIAFVVWACAARLALAPPLLLVTEHQTWLIDRWVGDLAAGLPDEPALARQTLVMVNPPDTLLTMYLRPKLASEHRVVPAGALLLGLGTHDLEVERVDPRTLVVRDAAGFWDSGFAALVRPPGVPMPVGTRVVTPSATFEVLAAPRGMPTVVQVTFAAPLDDPRFRFVAWDGHTLVPFVPPPPGAKVSLPARRNPLLMF